MIIGLIGHKGAGKSEVAKVLVDLGYRRERFAGPLKDMLRALGLTEAQVDGDEKETPCAVLGGATPRHAMQTLGTEWGRSLIHPNLWIMTWKARATAHSHVAVDDLRFPNEVEAVRDLGGITCRIDRPGAHGDGHVSEQHIDGLHADYVIPNTGSLADLRAQVLRWLYVDLGAAAELGK